MRAAPTTVVVLSDHGLFRQGMALVLRERGFNVAFRAGPKADGKGVVAIVDLDHVDADAPTLMRKLGEDLGSAHVVVVGQPARLAASTVGLPHAVLETDKLDATTALAAARRKITPPSAQLERMRRAWAQVTTRQRDVLRWLAIGHDNAAIANRLRVGVRAIKAHISALLELFGLDNRTQLALLAREAGLRPLKSR